MVEVEHDRQLRRAHVVQPQKITHAVHAGPVVVLDCQTRLFTESRSCLKGASALAGQNELMIVTYVRIHVIEGLCGQDSAKFCGPMPGSLATAS